MSVTLAGFSVTKPGSALTATAGTASGNLDQTAVYGYQVTFVTGFGETDVNTAATVTTTTTGSVNLTAIPVSTNSNVIGRNLYRTVGGGSTYALLASIHDNVTTTYTDTTIDSSLGAAPPTLNSAHSRQTVNGIIAMSKPAIYSIESAITARAGGGQALAYQLSAEYSIVSTVATAADSVKLPEISTNLIGMKCLVANDGANSLNIFPVLGQDASGGTNTAVALAAAGRATFVAKSATAWEKVA